MIARYERQLSSRFAQRIIAVLAAVQLSSPSDGHAAQCFAPWQHEAWFLADDPEIQQRLGPDHGKKLRDAAERDQWATKLAYAHIIFEGTPSRLVTVKSSRSQRRYR